MIEEIREKFRTLQYEYSLHALDQSIRKGIAGEEIEEAVESGEVIEDYPDDKYGPSCLVFGRTREGRPLHIQCTHPKRRRVKIITVYEPEPEHWIEFRKRRTT